MSRRRLLLMFGFLVVLVMLGVGEFVLWAQPRTAITRENAAKIQVGMTLAEVEAILGGPARYEATGELVAEIPGEPQVNIWGKIPEELILNEFQVAVENYSKRHGRRLWVSCELVVFVDFDDSWRVISADFAPVHRRVLQQGILEIIRRLLGL
jgi:hypothetical protein